MNYYGLGPYGSNISEPDEMEALQSDVMRFMAILGLCLMIIFALVQSLPQNSQQKADVTSEHAKIPDIDERPQIKAETRALQDERTAMYKELDKLQNELAGLEEELVQKKSVNVQLIDEQRELQQMLVNKKQQLQKVKQTPKELLPVKHKKDPPPKSVEKVVKASNAAEEKEGFTLRFKSTGALDHLIHQGEVQLVVRLDKQVLLLQPKGKSLGFVSTASSVSFHEMEPYTVPVRYKRLLAASGIKIGRSQKRVWGVVLPSVIRSQINEVRIGHKGGELQIDKQGKVSYHKSRSFL